MWKELEESYTHVKDVIMSATDESDLEYATWYWGAKYEVFFIGNNFEATKHHTYQRYQYAQNWLQQFKDRQTSGTTTEDETTTEDSGGE